MEASLGPTADLLDHYVLDPLQRGSASEIKWGIIPPRDCPRAAKRFPDLEARQTVKLFRQRPRPDD